MKKKVLVAMSGGVDSSVAAYLLKEQGYDCIGVTMRLYNNEEIGIPKGHTCCSLDDVEDARSVCFRLGIDFQVYDFSHDFDQKVIEKFVDYYRKGWTPNPCVDCNRYLKFDKLLQRAEELGCDYVASGHYARVEKRGDHYALLRGIDESKDQSYALYHFTQESLAHTLLPVGNYRKTEIRKIAEEQGFINARKHDSQDICFVPDGDYVGFLERREHKSFEPGEIRTEKGKVVGRHKGAIAYTIGQRRGLGVAMKEPMYVYGKDMEKNQVFIGPEEKLYARGLLAADWNWVEETEKDEVAVTAKVRYGQKDQPARLLPQADGTVRLLFDEKQRAIAPGQSVVCYQGDRVIGGGTIVALQEE